MTRVIRLISIGIFTSFICLSVIAATATTITTTPAATSNTTASSATSATATPPQAFMDLYYDFTGNNESTYPTGKVNISTLLFQSEAKHNATLSPTDGVLILFINSTLYIYDSNRKLVYQEVMRTNPASGFYEMTAISHIGPALAYLAKVKANGDDGWQAQMQTLLKDIRAVQVVNAQTQNNWLDSVNAPAWSTYKSQIQKMVDYGCAMAGSYIKAVLDGKETFSMSDVQNNFFDGSSINGFPIPFDNVMVGTFMLTALQSMAEMHDKVAPLNIDWSKAKVIIRFVAGTNVTAGLTPGSNWIAPFIEALANNKLPKSRIYIAPYAKVASSLGQPELSQADYTYYADAVWQATYNRTSIAQDVFTGIATIFMPGRAAIPGDYNYSEKADIKDFMIRLKYSLATPTEMLSNTVAYWMSGELAAYNWEYTAVAIPGLNAGFPSGITSYPNTNPAIPQ